MATLTKDPKPPESNPSRTRVTNGCIPMSLQAGFSSNKTRPMDNPIIPPPAMETAVPSIDMAPFVPGGTCFRVVMRIGLDFESIPSSEASVSPKLHPNYYKQVSREELLHGAGEHTCPRATNRRNRLQPFPNSCESAHTPCELYVWANVSDTLAKDSHEWVYNERQTKQATKAGNELQRTFRLSVIYYGT